MLITLTVMRTILMSRQKITEIHQQNFGILIIYRFVCFIFYLNKTPHFFVVTD